MTQKPGIKMSDAVCGQPFNLPRSFSIPVTVNLMSLQFHVLKTLFITGNFLCKAIHRISCISELLNVFYYIIITVVVSFMKHKALPFAEIYSRLHFFFSSFLDLPEHRHVRVLKVNAQSQADRSQVLQGFQD